MSPVISLKRRIIIICILLLLVYVPSAAALQANYTARENPGNVTATNGQIDYKTLAVMADLYRGIGKIGLDLNQSDFYAANIDYQAFRALYESNKNVIPHLFDSDADALSALNSTDLTVDDIRAYLVAIKDYNDTYWAYQNYTASGDQANATVSSKDLGVEYVRLSDAYDALQVSSATSMERLDGSNQASVNASMLQPFMDATSNLMSQISIKNRIVHAASSNYTVTLTSATNHAHIGDVVVFTVKLQGPGDRAVQGANIGLYINGGQVTSGTTDLLGECELSYAVPEGIRQDSISAIAEYAPPGAQELLAISDILHLDISDEGSILTLYLSPDRATFGDEVNASGRLTSDRGLSGTDYPVDLYMNGMYIGQTITGEGGAYDLSFTIADTMPGSYVNMTARYEQASGSVLLGSASSVVMLDVLPQRSSIALDDPGKNFTAGDPLSLNGSIVSENEIKVPDAKVLVYLDGSSIGNGTTDNDGNYVIQATIPYDSTPGNHSLYAVYMPDGGSLEGSSSDRYAINVGTIKPVLAVNGTPLVLFMGDMLNMTGSLHTVSGIPMRGQPVTIRVSDSIGGTVITDENGNFNYTREVNGYDPEGFFDISVSSPSYAGPISTISGHVLILPVDKILTIISLVSMLVLFFVIVMLAKSGMTFDKLIRLASGRTKPETDAVPEYLPDPSLLRVNKQVSAEPPQIPGSISELIQAGSFSDASIAMYDTARAMAASKGVKVRDSDTHLEFYRSAIASYPSIAGSLQTIVHTYERLRYGHKDASAGELQKAFSSLKDVQAAFKGETKGRKI